MEGTVTGTITESGQETTSTKNLILYDKYGEVCMMTTSCNNPPYNTIIEDIPDDYNVAGIDLETGKVAFSYKSISPYMTQKIHDALIEKNKNYLEREENKHLKKQNDQLNGELKEKVNRLEKSNIEIINYVTDMVEANETHNN